MSKRTDNWARPPEADERTVVVARFADALGAEKARTALDRMFQDLARAVADLFEQNGGEAHVFEVAKIYALHGLRNDTGWEQDMPAVTHGQDVAWALPIGAFTEDAEGVMWQLGAANVAVHQQAAGNEDWRVAPHPMIIPLPDEEEPAPYDSDDDDAPSAPVSVHKRTLH
jgi:hypothetical protein